MENYKNIYKILLPLINIDSLTYSISSETNIGIGNYVNVPFRNKFVTGIIWSVESNSTIAQDKIKQINYPLEIKPIGEDLLKFIKFVSKYYLYPMGDIFRMVLPIDPTIKIKKKIYYELGNITDNKITEKRKKLIELFDGKEVLSAKDILLNGFDSNFITNLMKINFIKKNDSDIKTNYNIDLDIKLSKEQAEATNIIQNIIDQNNYASILLEGVTGSGKTEVYFSIIKNLLAKPSKQILILLPEIVLATQLIERFTNRFGFEPCIWHSSILQSKRRENWHAIVNGDARLIIGARSALFLPFNDLSLIIVDEEHEAAYKQEDNVTYQARDMAIVRAFNKNIPVILSSATPSLETIMNVKNNKYVKVNLTSRYNNVLMPQISIIDMTKENLSKNNWISKELKEKLTSTLSDSNQSMLFLNRRGYAPLTLCKSCGFRFTCNNCSSWLVEHKMNNSLECHHCGYNIKKPCNCPKCNDENSFIACGPGVERIEEEVKNLLPEAKIVIITKDTINDVEGTKKIINDIVVGQYDIIIGTQMIAKGLHFPKLSLVGIIDADLGLSGGDLRAAEKNVQLLSQVSGRAGRENKQGYAIVQTFNITNPIIQALAGNNIEEFTKAEYLSRKEANMPPFSRLAAIIISGEDEDKVASYARNFVKSAPKVDNINILGPTPAILSKLRGRYRYRILIKAKRSVNIQNYLTSILKSLKKSSLIRVKIDIDPYNFY